MESLPSRPVGTVRFTLGEVVCPGLDELYRQIGSDVEIEGQILFLSDYGKIRGHFAVVQAKGINVPMIVPVDKLRSTKRIAEVTRRMTVGEDKLVG